MARGKAKAGDKTMLDALLPAVEAMEGGGGLKAAARRRRRGGRRRRRRCRRRLGRAKSLGARSVGHPDPGAFVDAVHPGGHGGWLTSLCCTGRRRRGREGARLLLEELGVPYRVEVVDLVKHDAFLEVNPMGKVPTIRHKGVGGDGAGCDLSLSGR